MTDLNVETRTFLKAKERSKTIKNEIENSPDKFRVLTGDRPTGPLHIGHLFGSLLNRRSLQKTGIETFIVIADYQVLTDRDQFSQISEMTKQLTIDYLSVGLAEEDSKTWIFPHSHIPELNQLLLPFLTLVTDNELRRNPTIKEEIQSANMKNLNAGMLIYPIHQAADILFCKSNLVPVGKDQLPHIEITRQIARRFNNKYANGENVFPEPDALLSEAPMILGLDGSQKMSKSRNNAIYLSSTEDETAKLIKKAKTDNERIIYYDPVNRPEVSNLLLLTSLCTGESVEDIAAIIGDRGSGKLKSLLTESLNEYLRPIRARRKEIEEDTDFIKSKLKTGIDKARQAAVSTLDEVKTSMNMNLNF